MLTMNNKKEEVSADIRHGLWTLLVRTRQIIFNIRQDELRQFGISTRSSGGVTYDIAAG